MRLDLDDLEDELDDDMAYTNVTVDAAYSPYPNKVVRQRLLSGCLDMLAEKNTPATEHAARHYGQSTSTQNVEQPVQNDSMASETV